RDFHVTGVQTCALPIWDELGAEAESDDGDAGFREGGSGHGKGRNSLGRGKLPAPRRRLLKAMDEVCAVSAMRRGALNSPRRRKRSEERRVGKECRSRRS